MDVKIVSGGQTGVDQGALEAAVQLGLEFGGWAPYGWIAEKPLGAIPEAYRAAMREYPDQGSNAKEDALAWLRQFLGMPSALVLNVAGPRESKSPGIQAKTKAFLSEVLRRAGRDDGII